MSLVTLSAAPYNPYNDSFAKFAMSGLQMGLEMVQHKDRIAQAQAELSQRQTEHGASLMQQNTNNMFKTIEMDMQRKESAQRAQNDAFNNELKKEDFAFRKDVYQTGLVRDDAAIASKWEQETYNRSRDAIGDNRNALEDTERIQRITENADKQREWFATEPERAETRRLAIEKARRDGQMGELTGKAVTNYVELNPGAGDVIAKAALGIEEPRSTSRPSLTAAGNTAIDGMTEMRNAEVELEKKKALLNTNQYTVIDGDRPERKDQKTKDRSLLQKSIDRDEKTLNKMRSMVDVLGENFHNIAKGLGGTSYESPSAKKNAVPSQGEQGTLIQGILNKEKANTPVKPTFGSGSR